MAAKSKVSDMTHAFPADRGAEAHALAERMAKYSHRNWIVWILADGTRKAAKLSQASLEMAMVEAEGGRRGPGYFTCYQSGGHGAVVGPNISAVWLANMKAGHFCFDA